MRNLRMRHAVVTGTQLSVLLTQYCSSDNIDNDEMGGACSAYVGEERCIPGFGGVT